MTDVSCKYQLYFQVQTREAKIRRYKQAQELKDQLAELSKAMESSADDETKRAYFLKLLQSYINQAFEELSSIEQEKAILEYMAKNAGGMVTLMLYL